MRRKSACIVNEKVFIVVLVVLFLSICFINKNTFGSGKCISGDCKNGRGAASFSNGDKYRGEWKDGKMHGQGTYTWANGNQYVGGWRNGKEHGRGTRTGKNGMKYVGEWKDGKMRGQGAFTWGNGDKYVGGFKGNMMHGQGTKTYSNGVEHMGEWRNGKEHGQGTMTFPNGDEYTGEFETGTLRGTVVDGQGTMLFSNGDKYVGKWRDEIPVGGWYYWPAGNKVWAYKTSNQWVHLDSKPNEYTYPNAEFELIDDSQDIRSKAHGIMQYKCESNVGLIILIEFEQKGLSMRNLDRKDAKDIFREFLGTQNVSKLKKDKINGIVTYKIETNKMPGVTDNEMGKNKIYGFMYKHDDSDKWIVLKIIPKAQTEEAAKNMFSNIKVETLE